MESHRLSSKHSLLWRGDLVRTRLFQSAYSDQRADVLPLIDSIGYTAELPVDRQDGSREMVRKMNLDFENYHRNKNKFPNTVDKIDQSPAVNTHYWMPTQFKSPPWNARSEDNTEEIIDSIEDPQGVPIVPIPFRPLATWPQLRSRLQPLLSRSVPTRKIDEKKLVQMLCRSESISKLPRIVRKRSPEQLHVIADRSQRCIPFFDDQQLVARQLGRELARDQCRFSVGRVPNLLDKSNTKLRAILPAHSTESEEKLRTQEPDPQSTVLILGDLAVLDRHKSHERDSWLGCCRRWRQRGVKIYALVPFGIDQLPREFAELVEPIAWQGNGVEYASDERREELLRAIFVRSYPAMQLEPALLRELRTMVPDAMDASLEADIWQHDWLASNHVSGARNDRVDVKERLHEEFERLDDETRRLVLSTQRQFRHCSHCGSLWQLEFLNQTPRTRKLLKEYKQDTAAMRRTLRKYEEFVRSSSIPEDTHDQIAWYSRRASEAALNDKAIGESVRLIQRSFDQRESLHRATRLEELKSDGVKRLVRLTGTADALKVNRLRDNYEEFGGGSSAVLLEGTCRGLGIQVPELDPKTRRERAFWKSGRKPDWVSDFGSDEYGAWCEFQVPRHDGTGTVTQRMRWIKPGEFMMGSPKDERGRWNDESPQHRVHLTQGFWMADTQVTQELWLAIGKRENPSRFKGKTNPVESVSWGDCQDWIRKLAEHHPSLNVTLPTEAQWEYACRAGSQTAYCFGDDPRELPKYGWFDENAKGKTHPVKQLDANAWGLYDMHGNVWECCQDWNSDYQKSTVSDPTGPAKGTVRVLRGGSWGDPARALRSACRLRDDPGARGSFLGFRLLSSALMAEPSERAMLPEAEPGTERARVKPTEPVRDPLEARFWKLGKRPDWVSAFGKDDYGLWCEFQLPNRWPETQAKIKERTGLESQGFVTQRMRWIKPGTFVMGSDVSTSKLWWGDETEHRVILTSGFWMADTPCTQGIWMGVGAVDNPSRFKGFSNPVERVSWEDCQAWLKKLGDNHPFMQPSLPTEAQWEYACRSGSTSAYCFWDSEKILENYAWYDKNSGGKTHPVGEKLPNRWGFYDVHGNVFEWCLDWYDAFTKVSVTDPVGPAVGTSRVVRGGSWCLPARILRSACRGGLDPGVRDVSLGFRLLSSALVAEPSERAMLPEVEQGTERARIGSAEPVYEFLRSVDLDATGNRSPEEEFSEIDVNAYTSIRVVSDQEGYQFDQLEKPDWAVDFGSDTYGLYATFEVNSVRQRIRWIPPGRFIMGSAKGKDYDRGNEEPEHEVILTNGYWMFDTPVTQGLWTALMGDNPSYFPDPERPVESVGWDAAVGFANKLNERLAKDRPRNYLGLINSAEILQFRLPTEAEWEYACRAGTKLDTYVGDLELKSRDQTKAEILDSIAWYGGNSGHDYDLKESEDMTWLKELQAGEKFGGTRKAAQKAANPWGLYDMLGNVWEWCEDWYVEYSAERTTDPVGPSEGTPRVMRGGSWSHPSRYLRSACRFRYDPGSQFNYLGFRLVSSARQVKR